jgi:trimeric autotransporter adhesin
MKLKIFLTVVFVAAVAQMQAQSFAINTTGATAHNSAILDVTSSSKGVLVPRVSTAQRTAIVTPAKGLIVYDSTVKVSGCLF